MGWWHMAAQLWECLWTWKPGPSEGATLFGVCWRVKQGSTYTTYSWWGGPHCNPLGSRIRKDICRCSWQPWTCKLMTCTVSDLLNSVERIWGAMEWRKLCGGEWVLCVTGTRFLIARHEEIWLTRKYWGKDTCKTCRLLSNVLASNR